MLRPSTSAGHLPPCLSTLQVKRKVSSNLSYFLNALQRYE